MGAQFGSQFRSSLIHYFPRRLEESKSIGPVQFKDCACFFLNLEGAIDYHLEEKLSAFVGLN